MLIIAAGFFFCGVAIGLAIGSLHTPLWDRVTADVRKKIAARVAGIGRPRRAKVVKLRVA